MYYHYLMHCEFKLTPGPRPGFETPQEIGRTWTSATREPPHLLYTSGKTHWSTDYPDLALLPQVWQTLAVPGYLTDSIFHPFIPHFTLPSLPHKFIYVYQLCSLPLLCYCTASKKSSLSFCSYSRPSELWKSTCGHDLHLRIIFRCSLWLLCGGGRCSGAAARAAGLAWLPACGTVGGFVSTQVCAGALRICWSSWWSGDTALFCNDLWCSNAPHTPSSRGEADVPLAYQSYCVASWAKGWNIPAPSRSHL